MPHNEVRIEQRQAQVGLANIAYKVAGSGPPIVLIHGLAGSSRWWERNVLQLAEQFTVYVVDLIGFGSSSATHAFVLKDAAAYLAAWMDRLGLDQVSVIGHSMGGVIAADLAAEYPSRIDRLVLVAAAVFVAEQNPLLHAFGVVQEFLYKRPQFLPILVGDAFQAGAPTLARAVVELLTTDITPKLRRIQSPTLVVWGERDTITPVDAGRRLCSHLPNGRLAVIERAGHNPMWEYPAAFNTLITNYITQPTSTEQPPSTERSSASAIRIVQPAT